MHLIKYCIVALSLIALSNSHHIERINDCKANNSNVLTGETVTYEIFYNWNMVWLTAGEVTFSMRDYGDEYHLSAAGRTYPSYEWFYKVRDTVESFVDKRTMMPNKTVRIVNEGKYSRYDLCQFDRQERIAVSQMGKTKDEVKQEELEISSCTHDILSTIYFLRNIEFDPKQKDQIFETEIYLDRRLYSIDIAYKGVEKRKKIKGLGRCNTLKFEPQLIVGKVFKEDNGMQVWVSNDRNKIPLLIESPVSVGSVKAILKNADGLKYPLEF